MKLQTINLYIAFILFSFLACKSNDKTGLQPATKEPLSLKYVSYHTSDSLLMKYKNQERPAGYTGLLMYDLLMLTNAPLDAYNVLLSRTDKNWQIVPGADRLIFENKKCQQALSRVSEDELFFIDYSPYHKLNVEYLKANGYFNYEDTDLGNSYFTCDSIFVTWRLNEGDAKGGSGMLLYNISDF